MRTPKTLLTWIGLGIAAAAAASCDSPSSNFEPTGSTGGSASPVVIVPASDTVTPDTGIQFQALAGTPPYAFSILIGSGTINSANGAFTAPASTGSVVVEVTDSDGQTALASVTVAASAVLSISPTTVTLAVNDNYSFSATGGKSPYTFSVETVGGGSIDSSTGDYTAPASPGVADIRVTDSLGATSDSTVTVNAALQISPTSISMGLNNSQTFSATGGVTPYSYSLVSGVGTINALSGIYDATSSGSATVAVSDARGHTSDATITVNGALSIGISHSTLAVNDSATLSASGGVTPYTYTIASGSGTISGSTYTAPSTSGNATLQVTDSIGNVAQIGVVINPALAISPTTRTMTTSNNYTFLASGGVSPYTFSVLSGGVGSIGSSTGTYSSSSSGTATIQVTDALNNTATASVTVNAALAISPTSETMTITGTQTFTGSGGVPPYVYSVASGVGSINATTGIYTAPSSAGSATVEVTDAINNTATASVTVNANLTISPSTYTMAVSDTKVFTGLGGLPPYTFSVQSGGGSVVTSSPNGTFTAPASAQSVTLKVTDSSTPTAQTATATITVNAALSVSPSSITLAVGNTQQLTPSGGVSSYTYSTTIGTVSSSGLFTAPGTTGSGTITVTDAVGNTKTVSVTVSGALSISPSTLTIAASGVTQTFSATGGSGSYTYTTTLGSGASIGSTTGVLTPPTASGSGTVTVTDSLNNTSQATVTVNAKLTVSPTTYSMMVGDSVTITASGGVSPLTWTISAGNGSLNTTTGTSVSYTAPGTNGTATVKVTDNIGNTATTTLTINAALQISPASQTLAVGNSKTFSASGGVSPYTYSATVGTINSSSGFFTAPGSTGSGSVTVTDSLSHTSTAPITINPALTISPSSQTLLTGDVIAYSTTGGAPPYTYSLVSGVGTLNTTTAIYTAPAPGTTGTASVKVTDSIGNASTSSITVTSLSVSDNFQYAASESAQANGITSDSSNNIYVVGQGNPSSGGSHWVVRESTNGGSSWTTIDDYQLSSGQEAAAEKAAVDSSGNVWVAGYAFDSSAVSNWIVREGTYSDGAWSWTTQDSYQQSSEKSAAAAGILARSNGDIVVTGYALNSSGTQYGTIRRLPSGGSWGVAYQSTITGTEFSQITQDSSGNLYASLAANNTLGHVQSADWVYESANATTWTELSVMASADYTSDLAGNFGPIYVAPSGTLYFGGSYAENSNYVWGVYSTTNEGTSWGLADSYFYYNGGVGDQSDGDPRGITGDSAGNLYVAGIDYSLGTDTGTILWTLRKYNPADGWLTTDTYSYASGQTSQAFSVAFVNGHLYVVGMGNDSTGISHWLTRQF